MQSYGAGYANSSHSSNDDIERWEKHILLGGTPPTTVTPAYTIAYGNVYPGQQLPTSSANTNDSNALDPTTNIYNNTYITNEDSDLNNKDPFANYRYNSGNTNWYDRNTDSFRGSDPKNVIQTGIPLDYKNSDSPYYVGAQWQAQGGTEVHPNNYKENNFPNEAVASIDVANQMREQEEYDGLHGVIKKAGPTTNSSMPYNAAWAMPQGMQGDAVAMNNYIANNPNSNPFGPIGHALAYTVPASPTAQSIANLKTPFGVEPTSRLQRFLSTYGRREGIKPTFINKAASAASDFLFKSGGEGVPKAQFGADTNTEFAVCNDYTRLPNGKFEPSCQGGGYSESVLNPYGGFGLTSGKPSDEGYTGSGRLGVGLSIDPYRSPFTGHVGVNAGGRVNVQNNETEVNPLFNATGSAGLEGEFNLGNNFNPMTVGAGVYGSQDLLNNTGFTGGVYGNLGKFAGKFGYNSQTGPEATIGFGLPIREDGGSSGGIDIQSPYSFQKGGSFEYNGETYTKREIRKMASSGDPKKERLAYMIANDGQLPPGDVDTQKLINKINSTRIDVEESSIDRLSGSAEWSENYLADTPEAQKYRDNRYTAYSEFQTQSGSTPMDEEEYHKLYNRFQNQNRWMNETYSPEELSGPEWDSAYSYNDDGTKNKSDKRGKNWKYKSMIADNKDFTALSSEEIQHMQAGFIGGKSMSIAGDDRAEFQNTGVADQTMFDGQAISGAEGFWGNTTNRQLETSGAVIPGQECSNAEAMQAACDEAGGIWSPFVAEVVAEDGSVTTPSSGCSCSKSIDVERDKIIEGEDDGFWLQDEMGIAGAMDAKMSLNKKYPWAPQYDLMQIDPVFKDPTREIAAISEQAMIAADTASTFAGPQRAAAVQAKTQGVAGKQIADAMNKVQTDNVTIANTVGQKNKELEYKTQLLNNNETKALYDNTVLTDQNYEDSLRAANAQVLAQVQNAYTNRANTINLNTLYPNFNIDMPSGGIANIVNPKDFYADPNAVSAQTSVERYVAEIDALKKAGIPEDQWPDYVSTQKQAGKTSGQRNQAAFSGYNSGQPASGRYGKETRRKNLLKKGAELRNWFSPLRGN